MIFSTITQKGLRTEADTYDLPTQNSNNFQLKFVKDEAYVDYVPTVSLSLVDSAVIQCSDVLDKGGYVELEADDTFRIKNNIIKQDGFLVVSIMLSKRIADDNTENIVLDPVVYKIKANITQVNPLPSDDELWQSVVTAYVQQLFDKNYAPQLDDALKDIDDAVEKANTASQNANTASQNVLTAYENLGDYKVENGIMYFKKADGTWNDEGVALAGQTTIKKDDIVQNELILSTQRTANPTYNIVQLKDINGNVFSVEVSRDSVSVKGKDGRKITQTQFDKLVSNVIDLMPFYLSNPTSDLVELKNFI